MQLNDFLKQMSAQRASDLYLSSDAKACIKVNGTLQPVSDQTLSPDLIKEIAYSTMNEAQKSEFEKTLEMNLVVSDKDLGRFRVNIFIQRSEVAMVIRRIYTNIPTPEALGLPLHLKSLLMEKQGLILFVGATDTGKSSSLASLINYRNENSAGHILTLEDPIEYLHTHKRSIINQREIGTDTPSYESALSNTLRQAPDMIVIGEIRHKSTMEQALLFSEVGHLCVSTLHANNSIQAIERIIHFFPEERKAQILLDLSFNLKAIVSQRLIPTLKGGRIAAVEVLLGTPLICDLIQKGQLGELKEAMERSVNVGMQTFDQALEKLYFEGKISQEEAIRNADSKNNLKLNIQLKSGTTSTASTDLSFTKLNFPNN